MTPPRQRRSACRTGRAGILLAAVTAMSLVLTGCATIPEESEAEIIDEDDLDASDDDEDAEGPDEDLTAAELVREFVEVNAESPDQRLPRLYLDAAANADWQPEPDMLIMDSSFDTVPAPPEDQPSAADATAILLRGTQIGTVGADGAFRAQRSDFERTINLRQQPDGQWRIADPPDEVVVAEDDFSSNHLRVPLYFFAPDSDLRVPDARYLAHRPQATQAARVVELLLAGPSEAVEDSVDHPLGEGAELESAVSGVPGADGGLVVPLTGLGGTNQEDRERIAEQLVLSLDPVVASQVRLQDDGTPLLSEQEELRRADFPDSFAPSVPSSELPGMSVVGDELRSLGTGEPISGPAGAGEYDVTAAAQSVDGQHLAVVERGETGVRLRVGPTSGTLQPVDIEGPSLTRPTWRSSLTEGSPAEEVWTVLGGDTVVRAERTDDGSWAPSAVDASELVAFGPVSALRLSRDGTRAAAVAGERLVVMGVERDGDSVALRSPRVLQEDSLDEVVDVDWIAQDRLVVATSSSGRPVAEVSVDGFELDSFESTNLTPPLQAITAAPERPVVVSDVLGQWIASDSEDVWQQHPRAQGSLANPFYPG